MVRRLIKSTSVAGVPAMPLNPAKALPQTNNPIPPSQLELTPATTKVPTQLPPRPPLGPLTAIQTFDPLVLAEEGTARGHFLDKDPERLTDYERKTLRAARQVTAADIERARQAHRAYREHIASLFETYDFLVLPTTATTAFPVQQRPREIAGQSVSWLWGAFPATAQFNVAGTPSASIPCGLARGLPVGLQVVAPWHQDALLLSLSEDLEEVLVFSSAGVRADWTFISETESRVAP